MPAIGAYEVFFGPQNKLITLKLIRYSLFMLLFPLATFYLTYFVYHRQDPKMLGWCGMYAVAAANAVVASYVYMAWNEDDTEYKADRATRQQNARLDNKTD